MKTTHTISIIIFFILLNIPFFANATQFHSAQGTCMSEGHWNKAACAGVSIGEGTCMKEGHWNKAECAGVSIGEGTCMSKGHWNKAECAGVN